MYRWAVFTIGLLLFVLQQSCAPSDSSSKGGTAPRVTFDRAVHFFAPDGGEVRVRPDHPELARFRPQRIAERAGGVDVRQRQHAGGGRGRLRHGGRNRVGVDVVTRQHEEAVPGDLPEPGRA